ncbi:MAG: glycoside hydrolase family 3 C-terminal domain-containing protein [Sedimentisphaerales bacterium]|nr:glycoside hydrolase family 3 C-terminal domain-containing protein [Sedimentisphaerales bacterium]
MYNISGMSLEQKIAQMIVITYRNQEDALAAIGSGVGGVWPVGVPRDSFATFTSIIAQLQQAAEIPLFICCDFEEGCGQLITDGSCTQFPGMMSFGALGEAGAEYAYRAGLIVAEEAHKLGVNITPAPVFDVNTVAINPICNTRSVGDDPELVSKIAISYAKGMASLGTLVPQAKHFPGGGMHKKDPHLNLEEVDVTRKEMESIHLKPFAEAVRTGVSMIMVNHAIYPVYDPDRPCTLSSVLLRDVLRGQLGFEGLIITDAMEMHGISKRWNGMEAAFLAIEAGNDLILGPIDPIGVIEYVAQAVRGGRLNVSVIDEAVERIFKYKNMINTPEVIQKASKAKTPKAVKDRLAREIAQKSITCARNSSRLIPIDDQNKAKILILEPEHPNHSLEWGLHFSIHGLNEYVMDHAEAVELKVFPTQPGVNDMNELCRLAGEHDYVMISTFFRSKAGQTGLLTKEQVALCKAIKETNRNTIFVVNNPYVISELGFAETVIVCYSNSRYNMEAVGDVIFGKIAAQGKLPVTVPDYIDPDDVVVLAHD